MFLNVVRVAEDGFDFGFSSDGYWIEVFVYSRIYSSKGLAGFSDSVAYLAVLDRLTVRVRTIDFREPFDDLSLIASRWID